MLSNRFAFAALGMTCIAAAAGGGYLASRQSTTPAALSAVVLEQPGSPSGMPVQETEALIGDTSPIASPDTPAASPEAPRAKRSESPARPVTRSQQPSAPTAARHASGPALERTWPSSAVSAAPTADPTPAANPAPADAPTTVMHAEDARVPELPRAPEPPEKTFEEFVVSADSVIGLQTELPLSSERARVEDRVDARVVRDVRVGGEVVIPAGSRVVGSVMVVEQGGKFKERARLGIRFHTLVLADGTQLPLTTETIYRYGEAPGNKTAAKIGGGAVAGAILGAILGGTKGAVVGATAGAGGGTAAVMAGDRSAATFPAGTEVTARILAPVTVTIEK